MTDKGVVMRGHTSSHPSLSHNERAASAYEIPLEARQSSTGTLIKQDLSSIAAIQRASAYEVPLTLQRDERSATLVKTGLSAEVCD